MVHSTAGLRDHHEREMTPLPPAAPRSPRVVELFGPSSGGKSSLGRSLVTGEHGDRFVLHGDRVLASVGLGWLPGATLRTLALDAIAAARAWSRRGAATARATGAPRRRPSAVPARRASCSGSSCSATPGRRVALRLRRRARRPAGRGGADGRGAAPDRALPVRACRDAARPRGARRLPGDAPAARTPPSTCAGAWTSW